MPPPPLHSTVNAGTLHLDSYSNLVGSLWTLLFFSSFSIHLLFTLSCSGCLCTPLLPLFFQDNSCFSILFFVTFQCLYPRDPPPPSLCTPLPSHPPYRALLYFDPYTLPLKITHFFISPPIYLPHTLLQIYELWDKAVSVAMLHDINVPSALFWCLVQFTLASAFVFVLTIQHLSLQSPFWMRQPLILFLLCHFVLKWEGNKLVTMT